MQPAMASATSGDSNALETGGEGQLLEELRSGLAIHATDRNNILFKTANSPVVRGNFKSTKRIFDSLLRVDVLNDWSLRKPSISERLLWILSLVEIEPIDGILSSEKIF
eukprot:scaffold106755_cov65-Attheya_sp.AAC.3